LSSVVDTPVRIDDYDVDGSFTVGVSIFPQHGSDVDSLVANAEAALYRAKAEQRGTIRFFEPAMDRHIREKESFREKLLLLWSGTSWNCIFSLRPSPGARSSGSKS